MSPLVPLTPKPVSGAVLALAGVVAVAAVIGSAWIAPRPALATPAYASQTGLACGRCHVNRAGGGALTSFGKAFAANGHKVPAKGGSKGKSSSAAPIESTTTVVSIAPAATHHLIPGLDSFTGPAPGPAIYGIRDGFR